MSSTTKLKMNYRKFNTIWTTVVAVLVVVAIAATVVMNFFSLSMEIFLGRGARVVEPDPEMSNVDTAYYESNAGSTDELNERTNRTAQAIAEQVIVLMENNNDALPIAKQSKVTPFGYRYGNPIYGGIGLGSVNTALPHLHRQACPERILYREFGRGKGDGRGYGARPRLRWLPEAG